MAWVGQGHKLIIQDSDDCGGVPGPDYSFLPYPFATSNPGAQGAKGDTLFFVEENSLGNAREGDPGSIVLDRWTAWTNNEIGDSNTIYKYDAHWCGHLFGTNVKKVNGFMQAYAHYGRGLIIYDGFRHRPVTWDDYRQLVTRQLAQGFDPDGLPCTARLGDFVITTEQRLKTLPMVPGRTYTYPLTLLSNQGYRGTVALALTTTPAEPGPHGHIRAGIGPARGDLPFDADRHGRAYGVSCAAHIDDSRHRRSREEQRDVSPTGRAEDRRNPGNWRADAGPDADEEPRDHPRLVGLDERAARKTDAMDHCPRRAGPGAPEAARRFQRRASHVRPS